MSCEVVFHRVESVNVFKVIGDQKTLQQFNSKHSQCGHESDWSALYVQLSESHSLGTIGYRWDQGYPLARLLRVTLQNLTIATTLGSLMFDGSVLGSEKASLLKSILKLPLNVPLMSSLAQRNIILCVPETETQWELVIPHSLVDSVCHDQYILKEFESSHFVTVRQRQVWPCEGIWCAFDERESLSDHSSPPPWLLSPPITPEEL